METLIDEIADGIYRLSTYFPDLVAPFGLTVNQFLVRAEQPLLLHTGPRSAFGTTAEALGKLVAVEDLRWVGFSHVEADECGALDHLLAAAPHAEVVVGAHGAQLALDDLAEWALRTLVAGEVLDLGDRQVMAVPTPHAPHGFEAHAFLEVSTGTMFCADLMEQVGRGPALTSHDLVGPALETEALLRAAPPGPAVPQALRRLASYHPDTLAVMHGSSFTGDTSTALRDLASAWEERFAASPPL
jgi:flavorubredoxin